eukprot:contig_1319_g198
MDLTERADKRRATISKKLTVDFLRSQDAEYEQLFQAMIDFRRQLTLHDALVRDLQEFQERSRANLAERKRPAATSAVPVVAYAEASRPPYYVIPSSSGSHHATSEALEDVPAA